MRVGGWSSQRIQPPLRPSFRRSLSSGPSVAIVAYISCSAGRTHFARTNVKQVSEKSGLDPWVYGSARIKEELARAEIVEVAETDQWRTDYLRKLLEQRQILHYEGDKEGKERLSDLINSLCIN